MHPLFLLEFLRFIPAGAGNTPSELQKSELHTVYPRWSGEHDHYEQSRVTVVGLSPLARGTHLRQTTVNLSPRFIPAGAGNTFLALISLLTDAVYPRWRGEHISRLIVDIVFTGLSPLARGTLLTRSKTHGGSRFIPAGAGNTSASIVFTGIFAVYPRWRGEHYR